ncbi:MAG: Tim44/TimA family putative adaptor protein [Rhodothalassiaceae bacterium]
MVEIILLAMVAGFIFLRLKSVLGRRPEDEPSASQPVGPVAANRKPAEAERAPVEEDGGTVLPLEADPAVRRGYRAIRQLDPDFEPEGFLRGAQGAYRLILEAFWAGDKDELRPYVSPDVFDQFAEAIDARREQGQEVRNKLVDISGAQVVAAGAENRVAEIEVRVVAEIVTYVVDSEGRVIEGNPSDTVEVTDIWTFQREADSADPNWTLVATRSG